MAREAKEAPDVGGRRLGQSALVISSGSGDGPQHALEITWLVEPMALWRRLVRAIGLDEETLGGDGANRGSCSLGRAPEDPGRERDMEPEVLVPKPLRCH